jgi:sigma-B regulation protein RsbU (phosphoserine phosphatase)
MDVDFLLPRTKLKVVSKITQLMLGKAVPPYELDFIDSEGKKLTARIIASTLRNEKGERTGEIIMFSDVSERKKNELALRDSERKFKTIIDNMNDVVFQLSPLGRIRYVSPNVKELYGYEPEELLGKHFKKTTPTIEMPRALEAIKSVAAGKPLKNFELCQVDKSGKEFHMEINATPIMRESKVIAVQGVMRDITEAKRAMESAAEIQRSLLPVSPPRIRNVDLYWKFIPCKKIGGDLFNVFFLDKDHLAIFMLDISGQGVCAAMMGVSVSQLLRPQTAYLIKKDKILPPAEVLKSLDSEYPIERFGRHFTISYLVLNIRSGLLKYSNAGHPSPLLLRKDGGFETLEEGGVIIGLGDLTQFEEGRKQLRAGDKLFIFTDGILEYQNKAERFYGRGHLDSAVWKLRDQAVSKILEGVVEDLMKFGNHAHPLDDVTILGLEFKGRKSKSAPKR